MFNADDMGSAMSNVLTVTGADIYVGNTTWLTVNAKRFGTPYTVEFCIVSDDAELQEVGKFAFSSFCKAAGILEIDNADQLVGLKVTMEDWLRVDEIAGRQRQVMFRHCAPQAPAETPRGRFVYVISADANESLCKIGIAGSPEKRLNQLSTSSPHPLRLEFTRYADNAIAVERAAHSRFSDRRRNGEWFSIEPNDAIDFVVSATRRAA